MARDTDADIEVAYPKTARLFFALSVLSVQSVVDSFGGPKAITRQTLMQAGGLLCHRLHSVHSFAPRSFADFSELFEEILGRGVGFLSCLLQFVEGVHEGDHRGVMAAAAHRPA